MTIQEIKQYYSENPPPESQIITKHYTITNLKHFINSHIKFAENSKINNCPYTDRLIKITKYIIKNGYPK